MRQRREEVDAEQFRVRHNEPQPADAREEAQGWSSRQGETCDPASDRCMAKAVKDLGSGRSRFYVKYATAGPFANTMLNPQEDTPSSRPAFRPVSHGAFDYYVLFLRTGNKSYLLQAERET